VPEFEYQDSSHRAGRHARLLTTEGVSTFDTPEGRFVKVEPEALALLTRAMRDIAHLRPGHLRQLRRSSTTRRPRRTIASWRSTC
jgi:hypothetical protein